MQILLTRFFGPKAFRPLSVMKSFENTKNIGICAHKWFEPLPDFSYLASFKRIDYLHLQVERGTEIDFSTLPAHIRPRKILIWDFAYLGGASAVRGLSRCEGLETLHIHGPVNCELAACEFPASLHSLLVHRPHRCRFCPLAGSTVKAFSLLGLRRHDGDLAFLETLPQLQNLDLAYLPAQETLPAFHPAAPIETVHLDTLRNLHDLTGLLPLRQLQSIAIGQCPKIGPTEIAALARHPSLRRISSRGPRLAKRWQAVLPPHIQVS